MQWRESLTSARLVAVGVFTAVVVALAVTGLWLVFFYRPSPAPAWPGIPHTDTSAGVGGFVRGFHRLAAVVALPSALVAGVLVVVDSHARRTGWRRGRLALVAGPALVVLTLAATFTGYLLPWDQLALWAVTVGRNMRGYSFVFGSSVKFVLVGGTEIATSTILRWFWVHTVVISMLLAGALFVAWRPRWREPVHFELADERVPVAAEGERGIG